MTFKTRFAATLLALGLIASAGAAQAQYFAPQGSMPAPFAAAEQRGYNDGVNGARKDFEHHRRPTPYNRDEFRNPHFIAPPDRRDYLEGFRRGYWESVRNIYGPGYRE